MRAWTHTRAGLPLKVLTLSTIPEPTITANTQVLIRVTHCALNPAGSIVMQLLPFVLRSSLAIPEMDFAGTIVEVGSNVPEERRFSRGTPVFGSIPLAQHVKQTSGALAGFIVVEHTAVVNKPEAASLSEVSGLGIAGSTALELIKAAKLKKGDSVLINGASGGIGHLVMQMCRNEVGPSGKVVAVCSSTHVKWVTNLGVKKTNLREICSSTDPGELDFEVVDYSAETPITSYLATTFGTTRFDAIIDAVGIQDIFNCCPAFLGETRPYVTVGPRAYSYTVAGMLRTIWSMAKNALWPQTLGGTPRRYVQVGAVSNLGNLEKLREMVDKGQLKVHVGTLVNMDEVQTAYECLLGGHAQGKIVVAVQDVNEASQ